MANQDPYKADPELEKRIKAAFELELIQFERLLQIEVERDVPKAAAFPGQPEALVHLVEVAQFLGPPVWPGW